MYIIFVLYTHLFFITPKVDTGHIPSIHYFKVKSGHCGIFFFFEKFICVGLGLRDIYRKNQTSCVKTLITLDTSLYFYVRYVFYFTTVIFDGVI